MSQFTRVLIAAAIFSTGVAGEALAHAHLKSATPAENAAVRVSPVELDLAFSEGLNLKFSGATLTGPDNSAISTGQAKLSAGDSKILVIPVAKPLTPGKYTVDWHVLSTDGHKTKGSYAFTVTP